MAARFAEHPSRQQLTNELHARPFQKAVAPGRVLHLAFKEPTGAAERDQGTDLAHLFTFLDRFGSPRPANGARQHTADLGRFRLKWECHTEFVSYTLFEDGPVDDLFEGRLINHLDETWLADAPGKAVAAVQCEIIAVDRVDNPEALLTHDRLRHFDAQSIATSELIDGRAIGLGDFRIHEGGFTRFALFVTESAGPRRIGRAVQRLLEIETYRTMAMLALPIAHRVSRRLNGIESELAELANAVTVEGPERIADEAVLTQLTTLSAEIEAMSASSAFRFEAADAYASIVGERLDALREKPVMGRQRFREFMARRFDPAMRTVSAAKSRIGSLSNRAARTAQLLRTRVNVTLEAQNQRLLESMDRRAALQLRLQETVEGLSVVAISYYAVSLAAFMVEPVAQSIGLNQASLLALLTVPVVGAVWWFVRRIRNRLSE